ncbi:putative baseplate assembly protein [Natrialbaceae archaeon AArc-T1-2]|uniref:putative baseplate assembly protein n=1 Tax=Natrialbaceae archaeon AArc-T1-2 TaxID=3053904 RepID=UPI00255AC006|nr:putative baseplate assembly protein [Natrialbaceae archaeon AArc-T1-2]WIV66075.1 putative baseplate assembly protein [Natrialbaceae archaeon AArc-T1-2]
MGLDPPTLDDRSHEELLEAAKTRIPTLTDEWTDHNASDPGITILEMLAWIAESDLYQLDRVTEVHVRKYLQLLGVQPRPPQPATVRLLVDEDEVAEPTTIGSGDRLTVEDDTGVTVPFEATTDQRVTPVDLAYVIPSPSGGAAQPVENDLGSQGFFHAFGDRAERGSALYLGFQSNPFERADGLDLHVDFHEENLASPSVHGSPAVTVEPTRPGGVGHRRSRTDDAWSNRIDSEQSDSETTDETEQFPLIERVGPNGADFDPSVELEWQYCTSVQRWMDDDSWATLSVEQDKTNALYRGGRIVLDAPSDDGPPLDEGLILGTVGVDAYWVRCVVTEAGYEVPPQLNWILPNVVTARQQRTVREEPLRRADGGARTTARPNQEFVFEQSPVLAATITVGNERWTEVPDFAASGPDDTHYVLDRSRGVVRFGDGITGTVPMADQPVIADRYVHGGGTGGNVSGASDWQFLGRDLLVSPLEEAAGGRDAESLDSALARLRRDLQRPYRAVTRDDVRYVAEHTPGLRFGRTAVKLDEQSTGPENDHGAHGTIQVVVVPESTRRRPRPSEGFLAAVRENLERHRLLTDRIEVKGPEYVGIRVSAEVELAEGTDENQRIQAIKETLRAFVDPLSGFDGDGWPFGRPVYTSELHERIGSVEGVEVVHDLSITASGSHERTHTGIEIGPESLAYSLDHEVRIRRAGGNRRGGWGR